MVCGLCVCFQKPKILSQNAFKPRKKLKLMYTFTHFFAFKPPNNRIILMISSHDLRFKFNQLTNFYLQFNSQWYESVFHAHTQYIIHTYSYGAFIMYIYKNDCFEIAFLFATKPRFALLFFTHKHAMRCAQLIKLCEPFF